MPKKARTLHPNVPEQAESSALPPVVAQHDGYRVHAWPDGKPVRDIVITQEVTPDLYTIGNDPARLFRILAWIEMPMGTMYALFRELAYRLSAAQDRFEEPQTALHCWEWSEPSRTLLREAESAVLPAVLKSINRPYTTNAIGEVDAH